MSNAWYVLLSIVFFVSSDMSSNKQESKRKRNSTGNSTCSIEPPAQKPFKQSDLLKDSMAENQEHESNAGNWDKLFEKLTFVESELREVKGKCDSLINGQKIYDDKLDKLQRESDTKSQVIQKLSLTVSELEKSNADLEARADQSEEYSKKYNLKIFNITENPNESHTELKSRVWDVLRSMDVDTSNIYLDHLHRLPSSGPGPRPILMKFVSLLDKELVWNNKHLLKERNIPVYIKQHFCQKTEDRIRTLQPIAKAAFQQKLRVRFNKDTLLINSQKYTVNNLEQLPSSLQPARFGSRIIEDELFFFSSKSPLSNYHPSLFKKDGIVFHNGEQFIQQRKAVNFGDQKVAQDILKESNPYKCKELGKTVTGFTRNRWEEMAPEIASECHRLKFTQHHDSRDYLLSTGDLDLHEAAPHDSLWGIGFGMNDVDLLKRKNEWGIDIQGTSLMRRRRLIKEELASNLMGAQSNT
jgi:ribA/ribD-fused uncharacterized protein